MYFTLNDLYALIYMFINWYCMHSFPCDLNCILSYLCISGIVSSFNILIILIKISIPDSLKWWWSQIHSSLEQVEQKRKLWNQAKGTQYTRKDTCINYLYLINHSHNFQFWASYLKKNLSTHATCYPYILSTSLIHNIKTREIPMFSANQNECRRAHDLFWSCGRKLVHFYISCCEIFWNRARKLSSEYLTTKILCMNRFFVDNSRHIQEKFAVHNIFIWYTWRADYCIFCQNVRLLYRILVQRG